ncbi:conserved hypothetical protein [Hyella patelloides LEGE 07179]|uniref:Uncharacterized protein n=1 Tax=Hyella patelloides LEGE 07179 TaxID=945734 RepID=A0A563VK09_9CYAN|nr:hypothetical protein [Hyella patelloides]VEP11667.1 conserved hypothetical protein [Hyella patelloides LEGE 07179]
MNEIEIKNHKIHEYKGLKIGIWKTANQAFIRRSWADIYFGDRKYLSDRGKKIQKSFKYLYLWDCSLPDGNSYNHKFGEGDGIFYPTDFFEVTESKAIAKAQNRIDLELEKVGMELVDPCLPTHIYDRETGQVTLRWCLLEDKF